MPAITARMSNSPSAGPLNLAQRGAARRAGVTSISLAVDKLPPQEQAQMLEKIGIAANPANFDQMGPHEVVHEVKGVNANGAEETVKTSLVGKTLQ